MDLMDRHDYAAALMRGLADLEEAAYTLGGLRHASLIDEDVVAQGALARQEELVDSRRASLEALVSAALGVER